MSITNQQNIKAVYQLATLIEQNDGWTWYQVANSIAQTLADEFQLTVAQCAGVIAALSPRNRWERNVQDAESLISAYVNGGFEQAQSTKVCTFSTNKNKALRILEHNNANAEDVLAILSGPKLSEFFNCIMGSDDVCIDGHAYCIWFGTRTTLADVPSIGVKLRREIKADYQSAAKDLGLIPSALQAITWCAYRRIHQITK